MLRKNILIVVIVMVFSGFGYYLLMQKQANNLPSGVPAYLEEGTALDWITFTPKDASFQIQLPTLPKEITATQPYGTDEKITYEVYSSVGNDGTKYVLSVATYPASFDTSDADRVLQTVLQGIVEGKLHNDIIGQTLAPFGTYPALDFDLQNIQFATLGRAILVGKKLYVITVMNQDRNNLEKNFQRVAASIVIHGS